MLKAIRKNSFLWVFFIAIMFSSCDKNSVFDEYFSLQKAQWNAENPVSFSFEIKDTLAINNLFINLRNNNQYEFSNIFLITKMKFPDKHQIIDTLEYEMADVTGKFLGKGFSEIKENKLFYKEQIRFPKTGKYKIEIKQAMRKNGEVKGISKLKGILDVGFSIEKLE